MTTFKTLLVAAAVLSPAAIVAPAQAQVSGIAVADPQGAIAGSKAWTTARGQIETTYKSQLDQAETRRQAIARAKYQLGVSLRFISQQAVQLHGGIGVTDEYIVSHYFRRLTQIEMTYGDTLHHLGEVSARMKDTAGVF